MINHGCSEPRAELRSGAVVGEDSPRLLLAAEHAVDIGARILRQGRSHVGRVIAKGDRDFATSVDMQIESAIKSSLAKATPHIRFLGEEQGGERALAVAAAVGA